MKKALFIITLVCCCLNSSAQEFKYYDLNSVQKDTTQYLCKNFIEQKSYFINKKFNEFLKYYEKDFSIGCIGIGMTSPYLDPEGKSYVMCVDITWTDSKMWNYIFKYHHNWLTRILITFKAPYTVEEEQFYKSVPDKELTSSAEALLLKDFIASDIWIDGKYAKK